MNKNLIIVVGITFIFLGVSIQPAIADNPNSYNSEDDCNIFLSVNKLQDEEKYKELLDRIVTHIEMNKELNPDLSWDFPILNLLINLILYFNLYFLVLPLTLIIYTSVVILLAIGLFLYGINVQ